MPNTYGVFFHVSLGVWLLRHTFLEQNITENECIYTVYNECLLARKQRNYEAKLTPDSGTFMFYLQEKWQLNNKSVLALSNFISVWAANSVFYINSNEQKKIDIYYDSPEALKDLEMVKGLRKITWRYVHFLKTQSSLSEVNQVFL